MKCKETDVLHALRTLAICDQEYIDKSYVEEMLNGYMNSRHSRETYIELCEELDSIVNKD